MVLFKLQVGILLNMSLIFLLLCRSRGGSSQGSIPTRAAALAQQREREAAENRRHRLQARTNAVNRMNVHPERYLEPFILTQTEFGEELRRRGWGRICERPVEANIDLVRGFYIHMDVDQLRQHSVVAFQGRAINFSSEVLNEYFGTPPVESTIAGISEHVANMPAHELIASLRTDRQFRAETTQADLDYESAFWNLFISHNVTPVDTHTHPTMLRFRVIYSLRNQEPLNFGRLMHAHILAAGYAHLNESLVFPHFISELLIAAGVDVRGPTVAPSMINLQSIQRLRTLRNLPRLPNARERLRLARRAALEAAQHHEEAAPPSPAAADVVSDEEDVATPPPPPHPEAGPSRPRRGERSLLRQVLDRLDRIEANQNELRTAQQQLSDQHQQFSEQQQQIQEGIDYLRDAFRYSTGYQRRRWTGEGSNQQDRAPDA